MCFVLIPFFVFYWNVWILRINRFWWKFVNKKNVKWLIKMKHCPLCFLYIQNDYLFSDLVWVFVWIDNGWLWWLPAIGSVCNQNFIQNWVQQCIWCSDLSTLTRSFVRTSKFVWSNVISNSTGGKVYGISFVSSN